MRRCGSRTAGDSYGVVVPNGCELEAVGFYEADGSLKVSQTIYAALSPIDRAAFVLHEAVYRLARDTGNATTSETSRKVVAELLSTNVLPEVATSDASRIFLKYPYAGFVPSALVPSTSDGKVHLFVTPSDPSQDYLVQFYCESYTQTDSNVNHWSGTGPAELEITVKDCDLLYIFAADHTGVQGKMLNAHFVITTEDKVIYSEDSAKSPTPGILFTLPVAHPTASPAVPPLP